MPFTKHLCEEVWAPFSSSVTTAVISLVLCLVTLPGNILICIAVLKDPNKELRRPFNYLFLNLAFSDIIVGLITEPFFVVYHVGEAMRQPVTRVLWALHFSYFVSCTASLLSLSALTLERFLTINSLWTRPLSLHKVLFVSFTVWFLSVAVSFAYFAIGFYRFAFIFANTAVVATTGIVLFAYARIHLKLRAQVHRWTIRRQDEMSQSALVVERELTCILFLIVVVCLCCTLPACVMIYVINLCDECDCRLIHWLRDWQFLLTLFNCSVNQFLYAWRMPSFCRAFWVVTGLGRIRRPSRSAAENRQFPLRRTKGMWTETAL